MVVLLDKVVDFYQVKTVMINNDDVKDKITALNLYGKVWQREVVFKIDQFSSL